MDKLHLGTTVRKEYAATKIEANIFKKKAPPSVTAQKPLADSMQTPLQPSKTVTKKAENESLPVKNTQQLPSSFSKHKPRPHDFPDKTITNERTVTNPVQQEINISPDQLSDSAVMRGESIPNREQRKPDDSIVYQQLVTVQKPLADSMQTPLQPSKTVTKKAENESLPVKNEQLQQSLKLIRCIPENNKFSKQEIVKIFNDTVIKRLAIPEKQLNNMETSNNPKSLAIAHLYRGIKGIDEIIKDTQMVLDNNELTKGFPVDELYRLFIDKKDWELGGGLYTYEGEPGYARAMLTAFSQMGTILSSGKLDFKKIQAIHDLAIDKVRESVGCNLLSEKVRSVNNLGLLDPQFTLKGVDEVLSLADTMETTLQKIANEKPKNQENKTGFTEYEVKEALDSSNPQYDGVNKGLPMIINRFQKRVNGKYCQWEIDFDYWNQYKKNQKKQSDEPIAILTLYHECGSLSKMATNIYCNTFEEKLTRIKNTPSLSESIRQDKIIHAIAEVCRNIQMTHPFLDGNARTVGCLLVNGLLMREKLSPAIIPDANVFDAYDIESLVLIIKKGQIEFQAIRQEALAKEQKTIPESGSVDE